MSQASAFVGVGRIAPNEERLVLSKPVEHFSFTYGVLTGRLYNYLTLITSLFIYCDTHFYFPVCGECKTQNKR